MVIIMLSTIFARGRSETIAITAFMTALVFLLTTIFQISIVATRGYFNVGEIGVYISALLFGPYIGAFAGGVGSALADIATGYTRYAPGTLVIKGCEGFITGWLAQKLIWRSEQLSKSKVTLALALLVAGIIIILGFSFYNSVWTITLGMYINPGGADTPLLSIQFLTFDILLTTIVWLVIALIAGFLIVYMGYKRDPILTMMIISTLLGGTVMVIGYFLYEYLILYKVLGLEILAVAEIPFNVGQAVVGTLIAVSIARRVSLAFKR